MVELSASYYCTNTIHHANVQITFEIKHSISISFNINVRNVNVVHLLNVLNFLSVLQTLINKDAFQ